MRRVPPPISACSSGRGRRTRSFRATSRSDASRCTGRRLSLSEFLPGRRPTRIRRSEGKAVFRDTAVIGRIRTELPPCVGRVGKRSPPAPRCWRNVVRPRAALPAQSRLLVQGIFVLEGKRDGSDRFAAGSRATFSGRGIAQQIPPQSFHSAFWKRHQPPSTPLVGRTHQSREARP